MNNSSLKSQQFNVSSGWLFNYLNASSCIHSLLKMNGSREMSVLDFSPKKYRSHKLKTFVTEKPCFGLAKSWVSRGSDYVFNYEGNKQKIKEPGHGSEIVLLKTALQNWDNWDLLYFSPLGSRSFGELHKDGIWLSIVGLQIDISSGGIPWRKRRDLLPVFTIY